MTPDMIARVTHEANRAYRHTIAEDAGVSWDEFSPEEQASVISGVRWRLEHLDAQASAQHDAWLKSKSQDGWKYGPVKDASKKEHPCMVPYDKLPKEQRVEDALFVAIVKTLS